jgi:hypothetical protein
MVLVHQLAEPLPVAAIDGVDEADHSRNWW